MILRTAAQAREASQPAKFAGPLFLTPGRVRTFREMLASGLPPRMASRWGAILGRDNTILPSGPLDPWHFPAHYTDPEGAAEAIAVVRADAEPAVDLAIRWSILRDPADAEAVVRLLTPWTTIQNIDTSNNEILNWTNKFTIFIQAALLIRDAPAYTPAFRDAMRAIVRRGADALPGAFALDGNRGGWGVLCEMLTAAYLEDRDRLDRACYRWRTIMDDSLVDSVPIHEVYREGASQGDGSTGLHYCNFFMDAMVQAAEVARFNGEWLYDYATPDGSTLRGVWEKVSYWTANPAEYPYNTSGVPSSTNRIRGYHDILHALWPNESSQALIDSYNATQDYYGMRAAMIAYRGRALYG